MVLLVAGTAAAGKQDKEVLLGMPLAMKKAEQGDLEGTHKWKQEEEEEEEAARAGLWLESRVADKERKSVTEADKNRRKAPPQK